MHLKLINNHGSIESYIVNLNDTTNEIRPHNSSVLIPKPGNVDNLHIDKWYQKYSSIVNEIVNYSIERISTIHVDNVSIRINHKGLREDLIKLVYNNSRSTRRSYQVLK